jgi:hypothetical protein
LHINSISPHPPHQLYFRYISVIFPPLILIITLSSQIIFPALILCDHYYTWHILLHTTALSYCVYIILLHRIFAECFFALHYLYYIIPLYMITIIYK